MSPCDAIQTHKLTHNREKSLRVLLFHRFFYIINQQLLCFIHPLIGQQAIKLLKKHIVIHTLPPNLLFTAQENNIFCVPVLYSEVCNLTILAYIPFFFISSEGFPVSATWPPSMTTILSAPDTVRIRCAMMITVLFFISLDIAS